MQSTPRGYYASVVAGADVVVLARVARADGSPLSAAEVAVVTYTILEDACPGDAPAGVAGHSEVPLDPGVVLYDSLQTDPPWDVDQVGYNFRFEPDSSGDIAFAMPGSTYSLVVTMQTVDGKRIVFRYVMEAI